MFDIPEFNLYLVRHGESATNSTPDIMGQTSWDPLTENGQQQAKKLHDFYAKNNKFWDRIYSSTYTRALNTAKIVTGMTEEVIHIDNDLREYDAGDWLGISRSQTLTPDVKSKMNYLNHSFLPPNGESLNQVQRRASAWLEENIIYSREIFSFNKSVCRPLELIIFSHGLTIKCLLQYIMGFDKAFTWKVLIDNTSVCKLSFGNEGWKVHSINDCSHLR